MTPIDRTPSTTTTTTTTRHRANHLYTKPVSHGESHLTMQYPRQPRKNPLRHTKSHSIMHQASPPCNKPKSPTRG
ncbi:hypothetical protein E2C01_086324 [Portunus trituberculatus]|uniref:Uncharacterized protein n=1 Tax=Portunus trituberculatus TaxID=210409 RepID=A0A5B7J903_PORTR|nr:hypothetical protein [Portunus trituberculatus]